MDYKKQLETLSSYFKNAESKKETHKIGVEFEHLILHEDLTAVSYFEKNGKVDDTVFKNIENYTFNLIDNLTIKDYLKGNINV